MDMTARELPKITVVIVTYNSAAHLRPTLEAALGQDYPTFEVILVDNASDDDSLAIAREFDSRGLRIIAHDENRGFSGGNNDGVSAGDGDLIVLLNPDAVMDAPEILREISRAFAERPEMGILGAKLVEPDGRTLDHCGGQVDTLAHTRLWGQGEADTGQFDAIREVDFVIGALFAIPRELWDRLGGFDEYFNPAFYEDTDLCVRCKRLGRRVLYWPRVCLTHHGKVSFEYRSMDFWWMHHKSRLWYLAKNRPLWHLLCVTAPAELWWFITPRAKHLRRLLLRLYCITFKRFTARRLLRLKPLQ